MEIYARPADYTEEKFKEIRSALENPAPKFTLEQISEIREALKDNVNLIEPVSSADYALGHEKNL